MRAMLDGIRGHPPALYLLFFTEMWERFTFYGMRALLILFMTKSLAFPDEDANLIYGSYQSLVYAMPLFGGMLADRLLGYRRSIVFGGITMALGSFLLAVPHTIAFYIGMGFIICGNGYFKPNISSLVGKLYADDDPRKDSGFSLFYLGINIGALCGGFLCGEVAHHFGWHAGFGLSGCFMLIGLFVFLRGKRLLGELGQEPDRERLQQRTMGVPNEFWTYALSWLCVPVFSILLYYFRIMDYVMNPLGLAALVYLLYQVWKQPEREARQMLLAAIVMIVFSVLFWGFYEQGGGSLNLYTERNVNLNVMGRELSAATVNNSLNPLFIVLLSAPFAVLWVRLAKLGKEPSTPVKFGLAFLQLGLGFYIFVLGGKFSDNGVVAIGWFALGYFVLSCAELCLSPIGLSMVTKLSPKHLVGMMMGAWFLASALGQFVAGKIGAAMAMPTVDGETILTKPESLAVYSGAFMWIVWISLGLGTIMLLSSPLIRRWMHHVH